MTDNFPNADKSKLISALLETDTILGHEAAARIDELEKMLAVHRLAVDVDALKARIAELAAALKKAARVEASLASRIANLMDALEPFAEHIAEAEWEQYNDNTRVAVRLADLRAAHAAYLGEKG